MDDYQKQATDFCTRYGVKIRGEFRYSEPAPDCPMTHPKYRAVKHPAHRNKWRMRIERNGNNIDATDYAGPCAEVAEARALLAEVTK